MSIHREGIKVIILLSAAVLLIVFCINLFFPHQTIFHYLLYIAGALFIAAVVYFFRKPDRSECDVPDRIISAADGKVVRIAEVFEDEYFHDRRILVSVFMSLVNIHVNWYPVNGTICYAQYHPGRFFFAYHPKSSKLNEHNSLVIQTASGHQVLVRQIAGGVARRIVSNATLGKLVRQGHEIGIIKFGSRMDLFLPLDSTIMVTEGQKVRGCNTTIGMFGPSSKD